MPNQWWYSPAWSPDGRLVAVQSPPPERKPFTAKDGKIYYGLTENVERKTYILKSDDFSVVSQIDHLWPTWSPDSKLLATLTSAKNDCLAIYDVHSGSVVRTEDALAPSSFAWSPKSNKVLLTQRKGVSVVPASVGVSTSIKCQNQAEECYWAYPTWSPDGKLVAACATPQPEVAWHTGIRIWDSESGQLARSLDTNLSVGAMSWSPDGKQFIYSEAEVLHVLASDSLEEIHCEKIEDLNAIRFTFSPNGKHLAYRDCQFISIRELDSLREVLKIEAAKNGFFSFSWSPDGTYILITSMDTVAICDAKTGRYLGHNSYPDALGAQWEPKGKSIILSMNSSVPRYVPVKLPPRNSETSIFDGEFRRS